MKILAIGDFHGKFPAKLKNKLKGEDFDLIISLGDFEDSSVLREIEFKNWDKLKSGEDFVDILGKKKYKQILKRTIDSSDNVFNALKKFSKPVITIYGNSDHLDKEVRDYNLTGLESKCKKSHIKLLKTNTTSFKNIPIAGFSGYRAAVPKALVKLDSEQKRDVKKFNLEWDKRFKKIFKRITSPKETIFIVHDTPYGYFDIVKYKKSPLFRKHVGDEYLTKYIKKYQLKLIICGHMHEYQGKINIGTSTLINPGAAVEGKCAIIDYPEKGKESIKVKFIK